MKSSLWMVVIVKPINPIDNPFRDDYFPRSFRYKKYAEEMVKEVEQYGGKAKVVKIGKK